MLFVLSPAKALDYESPAALVTPSQPLFVPESTALIQVLARQTPSEIAQLMDLSDALSTLNVARYQAWSPKSGPHNARAAVLAFNGDVYDGLQARQMNENDLQWLQSHVRILSGLYGVLRPLDWMQPYRLEMGTALATSQGRNLYQFWGGKIAQALQQVLDQQDEPVLVNLASTEYFKSVDRKTLRSRVVECVFQELRQDQWKVVSFSAKKARGSMVRYAVTHKVQRVAELQNFDFDGYRYEPAASDPDRWVFRRHGN